MGSLAREYCEANDLTLHQWVKLFGLARKGMRTLEEGECVDLEDLNPGAFHQFKMNPSRYKKK